MLPLFTYPGLDWELVEASSTALRVHRVSKPICKFSSHDLTSHLPSIVSKVLNWGGVDRFHMRANVDRSPVHPYLSYLIECWLLYICMSKKYWPILYSKLYS